MSRKKARMYRAVNRLEVVLPLVVLWVRAGGKKEAD
jgi:hypothetical protein